MKSSQVTFIYIALLTKQFQSSFTVIINGTACFGFTTALE